MRSNTLAWLLVSVTFLVFGPGSDNAQGAVVVDGFVRGPGDAYTDSYSVSFRLDSGEMIPGATLCLMEDTTGLNVGIIFPLTFNDNTFGSNQALDWTGRQNTTN